MLPPKIQSTRVHPLIGLVTGQANAPLPTLADTLTQSAFSSQRSQLDTLPAKSDSAHAPIKNRKTLRLTLDLGLGFMMRAWWA